MPFRARRSIFRARSGDWSRSNTESKAIKRLTSPPRPTGSSARCGAATRTLRSLRPGASPFWDTLSNTVVVLCGLEAEPDDVPHPRHRISARDHATKHRARYEQSFRLKLGRLCITEGQRVHHPAFSVPEDLVPPERSDPQSGEDFTSELTERDFGMIFNGHLHVYSRDRRVIVVAGVKGHGTRGPAKFLCDPSASIATCRRRSASATTPTSCPQRARAQFAAVGLIPLRAFTPMCL